MQIVDVPAADRRDLELDLRRRGFVPLDHRDAIVRWQGRLLPACAVEVRVEGPPHGKVVWSHPGLSGLDPRALGALGLVRLADGASGRHEPPLDVPKVLRWLLDGDVTGWLTRRQHCVALPGTDGHCLVEYTGRTSRCLCHPVGDPEAEDVARVLGDRSHENCLRQPGPLPRRWEGAPAPTEEYDAMELSRSALAVCLRLGVLVRAGFGGALAWDLARHGRSASSYRERRQQGFSDEAIATWLTRDDLYKSVLREGQAPPLLPLPPLARHQPGAERGLHWYARWKTSQRHQLVSCVCGAQDFTNPCRSCRLDGRQRGPGEWTSFAFPSLGLDHRVPRGLKAVACGEPTCPTSLATSVASTEGAGQ